MINKIEKIKYDGTDNSLNIKINKKYPIAMEYTKFWVESMYEYKFNDIITSDSLIEST